MNYDHNKNVGLFKFQSGYRKLYLNSLKCFSRKIINAQTAVHTIKYENSQKALKPLILKDKSALAAVLGKSDYNMYLYFLNLFYEITKSHYHENSNNNCSSSYEDSILFEIVLKLVKTTLEERIGNVVS